MKDEVNLSNGSALGNDHITSIIAFREMKAYKNIAFQQGDFNLAASGRS